MVGEAKILRQLRGKGRQYEPKQPIATEMFLPNYSGIRQMNKTVYDGSALTGVDGDANRTLTHERTLLAGSMVISGRAVLFEGAGLDYTVDNKTITFLIPVYNDDKIMVIA